MFKELHVGHLTRQLEEASEAEEWWRVALLAIEVAKEAFWLYKEAHERIPTQEVSSGDNPGL